MKCFQVQKIINKLELNGKALTKKVEGHVAVCLKCKQRYQQWNAILKTVEKEPVPPTPSFLVERIKTRIQANSTKKPFPFILPSVKPLFSTMGAIFLIACVSGAWVTLHQKTFFHPSSKSTKSSPAPTMVLKPTTQEFHSYEDVENISLVLPYCNYPIKQGNIKKDSISITKMKDMQSMHKGSEQNKGDSLKIHSLRPQSHSPDKRNSGKEENADKKFEKQELKLNRIEKRQELHETKVNTHK